MTFLRILPSLAIALVLLAYITMVLGSYVSSTGSGLGCGPDWPTCQGRVLPDPSNAPMVIEWFHRLSALLTAVVGVPILALALGPMRQNRRLLAATIAAAGLLTVQIFLGMVTVQTELEAIYVTAHQATATAFFGSTIMVAFLAWRGRGRQSAADDEAPQEPQNRGILRTLREYLQVTKPGIVSLLVLTSVASLVVAQGPRPPFTVIVVLPLAGALAAASGAAANNYLDRVTDRLMERTKRRALPSGRLSPEAVLVFSCGLGTASFLLFWFLVNPLSAILSLAGLLFYAVVYTIYLKRATPQNIVIGGAAGCFPALVGWAGATNGLSPWAFVLAAIIFLWTPPHFWALALVHREDYEKASIPMMPIVAGDRSTRRQIFNYTLATVGCSFALLPLGTVGPVYIVAATLLGGLFILRAAQVLRRSDPRTSYRLFSFSIAYIMLLFGAMLLDGVVGALLTSGIT